MKELRNSFLQHFLIVNYCLEKMWKIDQILIVERSYSRKKPNL